MACIALVSDTFVFVVSCFVGDIYNKEKNTLTRLHLGPVIFKKTFVTELPTTNEPSGVAGRSRQSGHGKTFWKERDPGRGRRSWLERIACRGSRWKQQGGRKQLVKGTSVT